jgi:hypothetical protein
VIGVAHGEDETTAKGDGSRGRAGGRASLSRSKWSDFAKTIPSRGESAIDRVGRAGRTEQVGEREGEGTVAEGALRGSQGMVAMPGVC